MAAKSNAQQTEVEDEIIEQGMAEAFEKDVLEEVSPLPEASTEPTRHGVVTVRTQALYNELDVKLVSAHDFINDIEDKMSNERFYLEQQIKALTIISNDRIKTLMDQRLDAINEKNSIQSTMKSLTGN